MRSIIISIQNASEAEVSDFLSTLTTPFWLCLVGLQKYQWNVPTLDQTDELYVTLYKPVLDDDHIAALELDFDGVPFVHIL